MSCVPDNSRASRETRASLVQSKVKAKWLQFSTTTMTSRSGGGVAQMFSEPEVAQEVKVKSDLDLSSSWGLSSQRRMITVTAHAR